MWRWCSRFHGSLGILRCWYGESSYQWPGLFTGNQGMEQRQSNMGFKTGLIGREYTIPTAIVRALTNKSWNFNHINGRGFSNHGDAINMSLNLQETSRNYVLSKKIWKFYIYHKTRQRIQSLRVRWSAWDPVCKWSSGELPKDKWTDPVHKWIQVWINCKLEVWLLISNWPTWTSK